MDAHAREAEGRTLARCAPPRIKISRGKHGWKFASPYGKLHDDQWYFLLLDAFGTKHAGVLDYFLNSICELVPAGDKWVAQDRRAYWYPSEPEFNAVLAIVASMRPQNEAHAAYAAQLGALHLASMKLGRHASQNGCERSAAILAKVSRAYGEGMERLARLQGKVQLKQVNQTIQVVYVDRRGRGDDPFGAQPYGADGSAVAPLPALPGSDAARNGMSVPSNQRQEALSPSWWRSRLRRALWGA
jgi:hypothetical protein